MAVHVPVESKGQPQPKQEKKPALQPAAPERSSTTYKKAEVIRPRGKEISESFSVQQRTEKLLAERVQNFVMTLQDTEVSARALAPWQQQFLEQFRGQYPNYDQAKLQEYALQFVQTHQGLVAALKIAEWELATYQRATGAYITDVQRPESPYRPQMQIAGRESSVTPERSRMQRFFHTGESRPQQQAERDQRMREGRPVQEQDGNYYFLTNVGQDGAGRLVIGTGGAGVAVNYDVTNLDAAQQVFLAHRGLMERGVGRQFTGEEAQTERGRIADLVTAITQARVDIYQATGRAAMDLNMIDRNNTTYLATMSPHLRIEERALLGRAPMDMQQETVREIRILTDDLRTRATAEVTRRQNQERQQQVRTTVEQQISELGQTTTRTPAEQTRLTELGQTIPQLETDLATARRPAEVIGRIAQLDARRTAVQAEIDRLAHTAGYPAANSLAADIQRVGARGELTIELTEMTRQRGRREAEISSLQNQLARERNAAQQAVIRGQITAISDELTAAWPPLAPAGINAEVLRITREVAAIERMQERPEIQPLIEDVRRLSQSIGTEQAALTNAQRDQSELLNRINAGPPARTLVLANLEADIDARLTGQRTERQNIEIAGLGRERQRQALEAYRDHILTGEDPDDPRTEGRRSNIDGVNVRAQNAAAGGLPLEFSSDYAAYPQEYLRAVQIMFGVQSVRPGGEALFQQAVRMMPPEMVLRIYNEMNGTAVANFAGLPANPITPAFVTRMLQTCQAEALAGQLGLYSDFSTDRVAVRPLDQIQAAVRPQYERITAAARDATFDPNAAGAPRTERDRLAGLLYHYDDMDDLVRRIINEWNVGGWPGNAAVPGGADYFARADIIGQAKRFAEEIERRREWRRKLHGSQSVQTPP